MAVGAACGGHFSRPAWVTHSLLVMAYRTGKVFNYQSLQPTQMGLSLKVKNSIRLEPVYRDGRQYKISGVSGSSMTKPIDNYEPVYAKWSMRHEASVYAKWSMRHEASVDGLRIGTSTKLLFASGVGKIHVKITVVLRSLIIPSPMRLRLSFIMLFAL